MSYHELFYSFYRSFLKKSAKAINEGGALIFVGINAIGKNIFCDQITSKRFKEDFFGDAKINIVPLNFKDKYPPTTEQLYKYWLTETARILGKKIEEKVFNDFFFYSQMSEMIKNLKADEKISFILLDWQNILNQGETFFKSLTYLHQFSYGKVSYVVLSEPQILDCQNYWVRLFVQQFSKDQFIFMKRFNQRTILADIELHEYILKGKLMKYKSIIIRYSKGLHGIIGGFCRLLQKNPNVSNIRALIKLAYKDKLCQYWVKEVLDSLPQESQKLLQGISRNKEIYKKHKNSIYCKWLVDLGFLKKNGNLRYPLMRPILTEYSQNQNLNAPLIKITKNGLFLHGERASIPNNEFLLLNILYSSKGKLVTFDRIGEILWKDDPDRFSLWAISQIVRRLRKRLALYSINPKIISSQRREGYRLD